MSGSYFTGNCLSVLPRPLSLSRAGAVAGSGDRPGGGGSTVLAQARRGGGDAGDGGGAGG